MIHIFSPYFSDKNNNSYEFADIFDLFYKKDLMLIPVIFPFA